MIELKGRTKQKKVDAIIGMSILELALKNEVDWGFSCTRGTCARCRCKVISGMEYLSEPNEAEEYRLDPEEFDEGYRLGCQAQIKAKGSITVKHETYWM